MCILIVSNAIIDHSSTIKFGRRLPIFTAPT